MNLLPLRSRRTPTPYYPFCLFILTSLLINACHTMSEQKHNTPAPPVAEPVALQQPYSIVTHGHERIDPYFWMRLSDDQKNADQPDNQTQQVLDYLNAENTYLEACLKHTEPLQEQLYDEIVGRIKKDDSSVPYLKNGYWYYARYEKGKEYPLYCRKQGTLEAEEQIMLDVNQLAVGHSYYTATGLRVSPDNKILAFSEDTLSRRIYTIRFINLETGEFLPDVLTQASAGGAWADDNKTFFYTVKNEVSLLSEKIVRHQLGAPSAEDVVVYTETDPSFYIGVYRSRSGEYLIIYNSSTISSDYHILPSDNPTGDFQQFAERRPNHEYSIYHAKDRFYVLTNWEAQNFRLMQTPTLQTAKSNWEEVIAHRPDVFLEEVEVFKDYLVINERSNAKTFINIIRNSDQSMHSIDFGEEAYVASIGNNPSFDSDLLRFNYSSMTTPNSVYDYAMATKEKTLKKQQEVVGGHQPEAYVTKRLFAKARDGKQIPISIVYKKGFEQNGQQPLVLYAYGSYGSSIDPWFSATRLSLLDRGFAWAIAHIRGGQEMGRVWYEEGKMFNKMNTFTDFIDCSQFLIDENYTTTEHLYALGGSAGGLLMGAVINMAPELYRGVIAAVPFVDVVSTMLDESIPLTTNEFDEWGNPKEKDSYEYMLSYSPYDQVKAQNYPNLLVTTGLYDSQVQYWEPAKWVAKLRDQRTNDNLLLLHTNMEAGHGGASGRFQRFKETALEYAFLLHLEGIKE